MFRTRLLYIFTLILVKTSVYAQLPQTGATFLIIPPDARSGGMGEAGAASRPDVNSIYWNASKLPFSEEPYSFSVSYLPWLRTLIPDNNHAYFSFFTKDSTNRVFGGSARYYSLGSYSNGFEVINPRAFSLAGTYSNLLSEKFSWGITLRYINSNVLDNVATGLTKDRNSSAFSTDISSYYNTIANLFGKRTLLAAGVNISNLGTKIRTNAQNDRAFLPANLRVGSTIEQVYGKHNISLSLDLNKLLVPSPVNGTTPKISVPRGIIGSFSDAPGGLNEEFKEIAIAVGSEVQYLKKYILRAGWFYENPAKGNRSYYTAGVGIFYSQFRADFSYLITTSINNPLDRTFRLSLVFTQEGKE